MASHYVQYLTFRVTIVLGVILISQEVMAQVDPSQLELCPKILTLQNTYDYGDRGADCFFGDYWGEFIKGTEAFLLRQVIDSVTDSRDNRISYFCDCIYAQTGDKVRRTNCDTGEESTYQVSDTVQFGSAMAFNWVDRFDNPTTSDCEDFDRRFGAPGWKSLNSFTIFQELGDSYDVYVSDSFRIAFAARDTNRLKAFTTDYLFGEAQPGLDLLKSARAVDSDCGFPLQLEIYDANPLFISTAFFGLSEVDSIVQIEDPEILLNSVLEKREGVAVDGTSQILLVVKGQKQLRNVTWILDEGHGNIKTPWADSSHKIGNSNVLFGLYTPPDDLPEDEDVFLLDSVESSIARLQIKSGAGELYDLEVNLVRPPVVLVHGTFDNPENCWQTPIPDEKHMFEALKLEGFKVFLVDYQRTNGLRPSGLWFFGQGPSSFEDNKKVVYENEGGIEEAVEFFRNELDIACTQADVIGHSMGGVLPRVYASDRGPTIVSYETDYFRKDNFLEGDMNRLISIASTHAGSELSAFLHFVEDEVDYESIPFLEKMINSGTVQGAWLLGLGQSGAVRDQLPSSPALRKIGPTPVPSHAVVCTIDDMVAIASNYGDTETFASYANFLRALTMGLYFNKATIDQYIINLLDKYHRLPDHLKNGNLKTSVVPSLSKSKVVEARRPSRREDFLDSYDLKLSRPWFLYHHLNDKEEETWITITDAYATQYETSEIAYGDFEDPFQIVLQNARWDEVRGEYLVPGPKVEGSADRIVNFFRQLIFKNDQNDCVVRYESQTGDLQGDYIKEFNNHIHSYAPRYPEIHEHVINILKEGLKYFDREGFPNAGRQMPIEFPDPATVQSPELDFLNSDDPVTDCDAICWSGMVPAHAMAFARIAQDENVVILGRPVNPDATPLIQNGNATKPMNLKGKSSSWGPQRGFIPEDQSFSKLWFLYEPDNTSQRDADIVKYNGEVVKSINNPKNIAVFRHLEKEYTCQNLGKYKVYFDSTFNDPVDAIWVTPDDQTFHKWDKVDDDTCPDKVQCCPLADGQEKPEHLKALNVLANPQVVGAEGLPLFYTADYDLLSIGFYERALDGIVEDPYPANVPEFDEFDEEKGFITPRQITLLDKLNAAVATTGYNGGNVSHHGPENQFYISGNPEKGSPYVDYPIIAFEPDDANTSTGNIIAIRKGPPGFRDRPLKQYMAKMRRRGYDLYPNQVAVGWKWDHHHTYTAEKGWDDRDAPGLTYGPEEIPFPKNCNCDVENVATTKRYEERSSDPFSSQIYPNPTQQILNLKLFSNVEESIQYEIWDMMGRRVQGGFLQVVKGNQTVQIELNQFEPGIYNLVMQISGKIISKKFIVKPK